MAVPHVPRTVERLGTRLSALRRLRVRVSLRLGTRLIVSLLLALVVTRPAISPTHSDQRSRTLALAGCSDSHNMPCTDSLVFVVFLLFLSFHPLVASSDDRRRSKLEAIPPSPTAGCMRSNTTTHRIVDPDGRERYFHGVNVVVKGPPWHPELNAFNPLTSFVEKDMKTLQDLGLNAIR